MLISLLLLILTAPAVHGLVYEQLIFNGLFLAVFIIALYEVPERRQQLITVMILGVLSIMSHVVMIHYPTPLFKAINSCISSIFFIFMCAHIIHQMFSHPLFSLSTIYGAICIYIILGIVYGHIYLFIQSIDPNAFMIEGISGAVEKAPAEKLFVFSYSILTTVGHTRVYTNSPYADSVIIIEQITGVMYLAVLISRLVTGFSVRYQKILSTKMRHHHEYGKELKADRQK